MRPVLAFALVAAAAFALAMSPADALILGIEKDQFARLVVGGILAFILVGSILWRYEGRLNHAVTDFLFWMMLLVALVGGYSYRFELATVADHVVGELMPSATIEGRGGEVIVSRRLDGNFVLRMDANGMSLPFVFDTGASAVVIRAEDAASIGIDTDALDYSIPISTANGRAEAAEAVVGRLAIGGIALRHVAALVTRPGVLRENLLGMTFLDKLQSFTVAGNRLILKGRSASVLR